MSSTQLRRIPQYLVPEIPEGEGWAGLDPRDRRWEDAYRRRWQHDKVVRSTHGVNCTGSCSWNVYVKDGIITWETQQTDYPTTGPGLPEYEPRGCPRGATYSWYIYSPLRLRYPYIRGALWSLWQAGLRANEGDPVRAWGSIADDPERSRAYKANRGKGGFVRISHDDARQLIAAAMLHTIRRFGPDRIAGFSPIPAMSMASYAAGARFLSLVGGTMLSFYDWYADLPPASPEIWGEKTDSPESADWYQAGYMIIWGSNIPITRTPDAHFMVEARYRGAGVAAVSPDYTDYVKFADHWLPARPGTDGALGMGMTYVVLKEFFLERPTAYFLDYVRTYTDLPMLVRLEPDGEAHLPDRYLRASDLGTNEANADWKLAVWDETRGGPVVPPGSVGHRWGEEGSWHLDLGDGADAIRPRLTFLGSSDEVVPVRLPHFRGEGVGSIVRSVPAKRLALRGRKVLVTTVYDLLLAQVGLSRGLPGDYPADAEDPRPYTPAWQEAVTGVPRALCARVARDFAENAALTHGRSMIVMGSGINQWMHTDSTYRAILNLVLLTGSQGVNGGGWAHYVGQEKVQPLEGFETIAFARDWMEGARRQNGTSFFYFVTDQFRYDALPIRSLLAPWGARWGDRTAADFNVLAVRLGWLPGYPQFDRNPIDLVREARADGARDEREVAERVARDLEARKLHFAMEDPDAPGNFPRVLFVWRANLLSASGKGHEYFLRHLLGTHHAVLGSEASGPRPQEVVWRERAPEGRLDLLVTLDFRMSGTALYSDLVLPAASWYEKHDLSSTDLHPFVHTFNPAVDPVWESRTDWDAFRDLAKTFSDLARDRLPESVPDLVALPLRHDTPDELAQPLGTVLDWSRGETRAVPGRTLPHLRVVEREYARVHEKFCALGPRVQTEGVHAKGVQERTAEVYERLKAELGAQAEGVAAGAPRLVSALNACEAMLALSGTTHGRVAVDGWRYLERKTGRPLADLARGHEQERHRFADLTAQPRRALNAPVYTGNQGDGRPYAPFSVNVERRVPWRTLSGRQHVYLDHELFRAFGDALPAYRPPVDVGPFEKQTSVAAAQDALAVTARWITPHSKWSIHTTFADNLTMLTLFRGGPSVWINVDDAHRTGIGDNDWIECYNRNGVLTARALVTHRVPPGMAIMYHAQDRTVNVADSAITGAPGGLHNSVTHIQMKPTLMVGGYGQFSFEPDYWGPVGSQRDTLVLIRKLPGVSAPPPPEPGGRPP